MNSMRMVNFRCPFIKKTPTNLCISHIDPSIKNTLSRTMFGESLCVMYDITRRKKTLKNSKHSFSYAFAIVGSKSIYFSSCLVKSHTHKGMNYLKKKNCSPITANLSLIRKQRGGYSGRENCFSPSRKGTRKLSFLSLHIWPLPAELGSATKTSRAARRLPRRTLNSSQGLLRLKVGIRHAVTPHLAFHFKNICK